MKKILFLLLVVFLAACSAGGQSPEPEFEQATEQTSADGADPVGCTSSSFGSSVAIFPQEGREMMINGFDFPVGDEVEVVLTAVTDNENTQIERTPTVNDEGIFSETVALPEFDYMRWAVRVYHSEDVHCHYVVMGQDEWLEIGYEGPQEQVAGVQSQEEAIEQDLAAISEATGVSVEELKEQMAYEDQISELQARLNANEADTFAGLWIERQPAYQIVVAFTENGEQTVSNYLDADDSLWDVLAIREATYSEAQLQADQQRLNDMLGNATFDWASYVDIMSNQVFLEPVSESVWNEFIAANEIDLPDSVQLLFVYRDEEMIFTPPPNLNRIPGLYMAQRGLPSIAFEEALNMDTLLIEDDCVFGTNGTERTLIVWQPGYFLHDNDGMVQILNEAGEVVAEEGQPLFMGGGGGAYRNDVSLIAPVPNRCQTDNVWYMGEFLPEEYRDNVTDN